MTNQEIDEIISKGQKDGETLYSVANALFKTSIAFIWIIGLTGAMLTIIAGYYSGFWIALGVILVTAILCAIGYAFAVFSSHGAKVLVHILFSNLAIIYRDKK